MKLIKGLIALAAALVMSITLFASPASAGGYSHRESSSCAGANVFASVWEVYNPETRKVDKYTSSVVEYTGDDFVASDKVRMRVYQSPKMRKRHQTVRVRWNAHPDLTLMAGLANLSEYENGRFRYFSQEFYDQRTSYRTNLRRGRVVLNGLYLCFNDPTLPVPPQ